MTVCLTLHIPLNSRQSTITSSSTSTIFLQGKCFHSQQEEEKAFQEFTESWSMDFYATEIIIFLIGKNMLIVMVPILINKDVFEPSYNDLKLMIQSHNYFCMIISKILSICGALKNHITFEQIKWTNADQIWGNILTYSMKFTSNCKIPGIWLYLFIKKEKLK